MINLSCFLARDMSLTRKRVGRAVLDSRMKWMLVEPLGQPACAGGSCATRSYQTGTIPGTKKGTFYFSIEHVDQSCRWLQKVECPLFLTIAQQRVKKQAQFQNFPRINHKTAKTLGFCSKMRT